MYLLHSHFILKLLVCCPVGFIGSTQWGQSLYDVTLYFFAYNINSDFRSDVSSPKSKWQKNCEFKNKTRTMCTGLLVGLEMT